jgi:NADP-dependent 3-hydroxy acid dehydrogenase YdfG
MQRLKGKTALVTGGNSGIGFNTEPFSLLIGQLAYESSDNPSLAYRFERLEEHGQP